MYFIVIPIIPERKQPSIVTDIIIPVFVISLVLRTDAIAIPNVSPAKEPMQARIITEVISVP